jgi:hypothetical protein
MIIYKKQQTKAVPIQSLEKKVSNAKAINDVDFYESININYNASQ